MAAMQELRDGGSVAMLSAVNDLYELLTFNEVMQDISIKDTEILDNMKNAKEALESDKLTLESQRSELQSKKADLDAQNSQMRAKQNELNSSVAAAQSTANGRARAILGSYTGNGAETRSISVGASPKAVILSWDNNSDTALKGGGAVRTITVTSNGFRTDDATMNESGMAYTYLASV